MDKEETNPPQNYQPDQDESKWTPEQWDQYLRRLIEESKLRSDESKFSVTMLVDQTGVVDAKISVPLEIDEEMKEWSGKLLGAIANGEVGPLLIQGLSELSKNGTDIEKDAVSSIMEIWDKRAGHNKPCIKPTEVLKK